MNTTLDEKPKIALSDTLKVLCIDDQPDIRGLHHYPEGYVVKGHVYHVLGTTTDSFGATGYIFLGKKVLMKCNGLETGWDPIMFKELGHKQHE